MDKTINQAKTVQKQLGFGYLLSVDSDPKTAKSNKRGEYLTAIQFLAPYDTSGSQLCPFASAGCAAACLNTAGNPAHLESKLRARNARTQMYLRHREAYKTLLVHELRKFVAKCERLGVKPAVRLNGTSDIPWERIFPTLFDMFPQVQFYDYTKNPNRFYNLPCNYHLTFSRAEDNDFNSGRLLARGFPVAMVFDVTRTKPLPKTHKNYAIDDGDVDDLTFLRTPGIIGLRAKGKAKKDLTGFVLKC